MFLRINTIPETLIASDVVKIRAKIGEIVVERKRLRFGPINLFQFMLLVKDNLILRGFQLERGIPRSTVRSIEAASRGMSMCERSIHDVSVIDPEQQLMNADAGQKISFSKQAVISSAV